MLLNSIVSDLPTYLVMNITLALIWQWWRIAKMLTEPEKEIANVKSGRPLRRLILIQIILLGVAIVDACFLTAHYGYGVWVKNGSVETGGIVKNDPRWIAIRSCYKLIQLIILTVMLYLSCLVFYKTSQAIKSDEGYSPLRRQVNIFMSAWLL